MDPQVIKAIEQAVQEGMTSAGWIAVALGLGAAAIGGFLGAYLRRRGENVATKEDFQELLRQVRAQSKATEEIRGDVAERLAAAADQQKPEPSAWGEFRQEVLREVWAVHRGVADSMAAVIVSLQQSEREGRMDRFYGAIDDYRIGVHRGIDLLTPQALDLAQQFLETSCDIAEGKRKLNDANDLKGVRRGFYEHMTAYFRLEEVLPWTVQKPSRKGQKGERAA